MAGLFSHLCRRSWGLRGYQWHHVWEVSITSYRYVVAKLLQPVHIGTISWHCPFKTKFKYFNLHFKFKNLSPPNIPLSSHRILIALVQSRNESIHGKSWRLGFGFLGNIIEKCLQFHPEVPEIESSQYYFFSIINHIKLQSSEYWERLLRERGRRAHVAPKGERR